MGKRAQRRATPRGVGYEPTRGAAIAVEAESLQLPNHGMDREPTHRKLAQTARRLHRIEWLGTTGLTGRLC